jgi:tRNA A-37 threonylcarbamoyl transferase component Bud32/tetratricopeptide (TPR) repeat protein
MATQPLDQSNREQLLDDVLTAHFKAVDAGQTPDREALFELHPDLADELRGFFQGQDRLDQFAAPLRPAARAAREDLIDTRIQDTTPYTTEDVGVHKVVGVVGDYEILEEIAQGGMGVVYKARHRQLHRFVALKVLLAGPFARAVDLLRFRSETEIVASLDHPNIVPIYDVGALDQQPYFSMKLIEGGSLATYADRFIANPHAAAELLVILARAVHHAHQRGILHRDLKPSNVLLDRDGQPHLTDFGLARWVAEDKGLSHSGAIVGTPSYMAPEQMVGQRHLVTTASDVYGLGAILYYMLTGSPPFQGQTPLETMQHALEREPEKPRDCNPLAPRDLEIICLRCLAKDPPSRYASAQDLADDLSRFLGGAPIQARTASRLERLQKWARRKPAQAALVAVSSFALVALLAGGLVYEHRLRGAWAEAEANAGDARRQKDRADANYREARETLRRILQKSKERDLAGIPRLHELERRQSEEAIAFYLKLAEESGDDPEIRQDIALAQHDAAQLQFALGRAADARKNLKLACAQFRELVHDYPDKLEYRAGLAGCLNALGGMETSSEEFARCTEESMALLETLARDQPEREFYGTALAVACNQLAIARANANRPAEAKELYARAIALREHALIAHPNDRVLRASIAETCVNLGALLNQLKDHARVKELFDRAEAEFISLIHDDPDDLSQHTAVAALRLNRTYILLANKQRDAALSELTKNIADLTPLLLREPESADLRDRLLRSHGFRAEIYAQDKRFAESLADTQKTVECAQPDDRELRRLFLAMAYARAGKHAEAIAESKALAAHMTEKTPFVHRTHLASVCGIAAKSVAQDATMSEPAKTSCEAAYVAVGLEQMREARRAVNYLEWLFEMPEFLANPDLTPLRADPRWWELWKP